MPLTPRPYRAHADLAAVHAVLTAGRAAMQAGGRAYYVHPGDVNWWLFYLNQADDPAAHLTLWEQAGQVAGWSLLSPAFAAFDVFLLPALRGTPEAAAVWAWTEAQLLAVLGGASAQLQTVWVSEDDDVLTAWLAGRGYTPSADDYLWSLERPLAGALPAPCPPDGFTLRPLAGEAETAPRALAAHAAFGSRQPAAGYVERYRRFMRSPVYAGALDLVAVPPSLPTGHPPAERHSAVAAFALAWTDPANGVGLFEPVGTHPRYQRQGLGRALLLEGLRRWQQAGLRTATVCVESGSPAALRLYESVGFAPARKLLTFTKTFTKEG